MGRHEVQRVPSAESVREFSRAVLRDLEALELLLERGMIESGVCRIGAEQELFLTDAAWQPLPVAAQLLRDLDDTQFTTEIAQFNLEINLPPLDVRPDVLGAFHTCLDDAVRRAAAAAERHGAQVIMTGILPTLAMSHLSIENVTPSDRYHALNQAVMKQAGGRVHLHLEGIDELQLEHDSVMLESCNTSFQIHLQVDPAGFARSYNTAQLVCAPVLAAAVNSPLLFGKRLWQETRIGLFQQSVDTRQAASYPRDVLPRVWFGQQWVAESVIEVFRENVLRHRMLFAVDSVEDPIRVLEAGGVPHLEALQLHNGTVYRWNRPCYGVLHGRPHLRIECRALPAGPSVVDEIANAAFWIGLVVAGPDAFGDLPRRMSFDDAKANFYAAARLGLDTTFMWLDGERVGAAQLIRERLLPIARRGLLDLGILESQADRYLGIIDQRVETGFTGARWLVRSDFALRDACSRAERLAALTAIAAARSATREPVHTWPLASPAELDHVRGRFDRVEHCMTTDLLTVHEDDAVDLVAFIMNQRTVRQLLVEDDEGRLAGIISYRSLLHYMATGRLHGLGGSVPVRDIMATDLTTVTPDTLTLDAIRLMREKNVTALPVVKGDRLVGIVSEHDFLPIVARLLRERIEGSA